MAGYSGKLLAEKLGIKIGDTVFVVQPPVGYRSLIVPLPAGIQIVTRAPAKPVSFVHVFVKQKSSLEKQLKTLKTKITKDGMIWVSWPKKASGVKTDVTENDVRNTALAIGLVDVKVCAVDDTWSGLKLVYRLKDR